MLERACQASAVISRRLPFQAYHESQARQKTGAALTSGHGHRDCDVAEKPRRSEEDERRACETRSLLQQTIDALSKGTDAESAGQPLGTTAKGAPGRRGYPLKALDYAKKLREKNPSMKAHTIRQECLKKFDEDELPPDADAFRRWLNRKRANRAN